MPEIFSIWIIMNMQMKKHVKKKKRSLKRKRPFSRRRKKLFEKVLGMQFEWEGEKVWVISTSFHIAKRLQRKIDQNDILRPSSVIFTSNIAIKRYCNILIKQFFWSKYCFCFSKSAEITMNWNFQFTQWIKKCLFIAILLAKIARLTWA